MDYVCFCLKLNYYLFDNKYLAKIVNQINRSWKCLIRSRIPGVPVRIPGFSHTGRSCVHTDDLQLVVIKRFPFSTAAFCVEGFGYLFLCYLIYFVEMSNSRLCTRTKLLQICQIRTLTSFAWFQNRNNVIYFCYVTCFRVSCNFEGQKRPI